MFVALAIFQTLLALTMFGILPSVVTDRKAAEAVLATVIGVGCGSTAFILWGGIL